MHKAPSSVPGTRLFVLQALLSALVGVVLVVLGQPGMEPHHIKDTST